VPTMSSPARRFVPLALATAAALVLAGCGSSDNATSGNTGSAPATTASSAATASSASSATSSAPEISSATGESGSTGATGESSASAPASSLPPAQLTLLFGSSGTAETNALNAATKAWGEQSGSTVQVTPAQDLVQQLAQGFSSGKAPDLFYVGADQFANYAKAGNLLDYADSLSNASDFYPALKASFTYDGKLYCAPKDFSTLALFINTDMWSKAGLTDSDIPKNWDGLEAAAKKLTSGSVPGLTISPERDRLDAFLVQNGGYLVDVSGQPTANSQQNVDALAFVKKMYTDGVLKWPKDLGASWAGEGFGKGQAAMTIEGNWLVGALASDYPNLKYKVVELPTGPTGTKGTLSFTNCWGISATTKNPEQAKALVEYLTAADQQMTFAKAFAVIPSIESAKASYLEQFPDFAPFVTGVDYAKGVVSAPGVTDVLNDYNSQLQNLANTDPKSILDSVQDNLTAALGG
jgi:multiple sugar transport system substrate-binding protein